ncbi:MAG TPA: hypothetical protein VKQ36_04900 [Ktedonobacterales bacterium]|nr:hypothetical protein [Ktedonobacterales bacterium]
MLVDAHRQAALDMEQTIATLGDPAVHPYISRLLIEAYWGASFHWIAVGCQEKHGKHKENHTQLAKFLRDQNEDTIAAIWDRLDERRRAGWYGHQTAPTDIAAAEQWWQDIKGWATTP